MSRFSLLQPTKKQEKKELEASPGTKELLYSVYLLYLYKSTSVCDEEARGNKRAGSFAR
jgi:hypothetical protein